MLDRWHVVVVLCLYVALMFALFIWLLKGGR